MIAQANDGCHFLVPSPHEARQDKTTTAALPTSQFYNYSIFRFRAASCLIFGRRNIKTHIRIPRNSEFVQATPHECSTAAAPPSPRSQVAAVDANSTGAA